jgi:hypothetical protein
MLSLKRFKIFLVFTCVAVLGLMSCQPLMIRGKVTDRYGKPIAGAKMLVTRTGAYSVSDEEGNVLLDSLSIEDRLVITAAGYEPTYDIMSIRMPQVFILEKSQHQ